MTYTIDTGATVRAVHQAFEKANAMPEGAERDHLMALANSALSAALVYVRAPHPPVQKKHYDAVQALLAVLGNAHDQFQFGDDSA